MADTIANFVSLLRSGDKVDATANLILRAYKNREQIMSKDTALNLRLRAKAARRQSEVTEDPRQKLVQARRAEDFEKLARDAEH